MSLTMSHVVAGYGAGDVLQSVDLTVPDGSISCIIGPNGAGKSTVLRVISGLLRPRKGSIDFFGAEIHNLTSDKILTSGISQVPQSQGLFTNISVRDNVLMGGWMIRRHRRLVKERLKEVERLFPIVADRPHERAGNLSGGQRRQVEFARALMLRPKLVLLDEPSLGLDPQNVRKLRSSIEAIRDSGATVLLVEQQVKFALTVADYGIVMERGRVVMFDEAAAVLNNPEMASLYFGGDRIDANGDAESV